MYILIGISVYALVLSLLELYLPRCGTKELWQKHRIRDDSILRRLFPFKELKDCPFSLGRLVPVVFFSFIFLLSVTLCLLNSIFSFVSDVTEMVLIIGLAIVCGLYLLYLVIYILTMNILVNRQYKNEPLFSELKKCKFRIKKNKK